MKRMIGLVLILLLIVLMTTLLPGHVGATDGEDDCPTATPEVTLVTPTQTPTDASPTPTATTITSTPTPTDPTGVPQTVTPSRTPSVPQTVTCKTQCVYNQSGLPGTHAVTAVSPQAQGPYYWQIKINGVWYNVYDCNGTIVTTTPESRGETTITRLIVDSSAPTNPDDYRVVGGAGAILFDNFDY